MAFTWASRVGHIYKIEYSTDLVNWSDATSYTQSYTNGAIPGDTSGTWTHTSPGTGPRFYLIVRTPAP